MPTAPAESYTAPMVTMCCINTGLGSEGSHVGFLARLVSYPTRAYADADSNPMCQGDSSTNGDEMGYTDTVHAKRILAISPLGHRFIQAYKRNGEAAAEILTVSDFHAFELLGSNSGGAV